MALEPGSKAPDFTLSSKTSQGPTLVTLSEERTRGPVVLLFFPMAFTGVCTQELCDVSQGLAAYSDLGATVLGISGDNPFAQEAWAQKESISVPLLSDYDHSVAQAYGVAYESFLPSKNLPMGGVAQRSAFVVDREGVIRYSETSPDPTQLPNFDAIKAKLQELA